MYKYSIFFLLSIIIGCQSIDKKPLPSTLLSEDEMVVALTELTILKASTTVASGIKKYSGIIIKDYISEKIGVDSTLVVENIAYYSYQPEDLMAIYKRVSDSLEKRFQLHDSLLEVYTKNISSYKNYDNDVNNRQ